MSLIDVKAYVRSRMLSLGYQEWYDGFGSDNIPNTVMDNAWHMEFGVGVGAKMNQQPLDIQWPFTLRLFRSNSRDPSGLIDEMVVMIDTLLKDLLKASNRVTYVGGLKNLSLQSFRIERLNNTNDNGVLGTVEFNALIVIGID